MIGFYLISVALIGAAIYGILWIATSVKQDINK